VMFGPVEKNICLAALARSAVGSDFGFVPERQRQLVRLGRETWNEGGPTTDERSFNQNLGAALEVCAAARNPGGLVWARQLWASAQDCGDLNPLSFKTFARVLEAYQQHEDVDKMMEAAKGEEWLDYVLLCALVNLAAERQDWERAVEVWRRLVKDHGVEPNIVAYNAMSKAHMICGRILEAARILAEIDEVFLNSNYKTVVDRVQVLLIACHSSPTQENRIRLQDAIKSGENTVKEDASRHAAREWGKMKRATQRLEQNVASMKLRDVVVEWKASTQSVMRTWPNHAGGSRYLGELDGSP